MSILFIGVDAGGTRTRAILATERGDVLGTGRGDGANVWSSGTRIGAVIGTVLRSALGQVDPSLVAGGVIAVAGSVTAPEVSLGVATGWRSVGLPGSPALVPDVLAAYAAGTVEPRGVVLVAGTGSIAAAVDERSARAVSGGHGWLLGDEGSAVWLGLQGIRAALRALDGTGPATALSERIRDGLGVVASDPRSMTEVLVAAAHERPPAQLGRLAPTVLEVAAGGDAVAQGIVGSGADHLVRLVATLVGDDPPRVIVLAGSLLSAPTEIRSSVRARLAVRWPGTPLVETPSGEAGATALAIARHTGKPVSASTLARLRGGRGAP